MTALSRLQTSQQRAIILDGGTGAELQHRGIAPDPVCWHALAAVTDHAELVSVHVDFINAGADVITTNTFATHRYVIEAASPDLSYERIVHSSVAAARRARTETGGDVAIAGSMSCMPPAYRIENYPADAAAQAAYREHAQMLAELGVDLITLEMIQDRRHGHWALEAALATGLPVWLGLSCRSENDTLTGFDRTDEPFADIVDELAAMQPHMINIMHTPIDALDAAFACVRDRWNGPIGMYPEVGSFDAVRRRRSATTTPADFCTAAGQWIERGIAVIGGCCGATPAHIEALHEMLDARPAISGS